MLFLSNGFSLQKSAFTNLSSAVGTKYAQGFYSSKIESLHNNRIRLNQHRSNGPPPQETFLDVNELVDSPFTSTAFASTHCWGRRPLLWRRAFISESERHLQYAKSKHVDGECPWPSWDEVVECATFDEAESRIITHQPNDVTSWELDVGPFRKDDLNLMLKLAEDKLETTQKVSSLVLNDVDRHYPPLYDWIFDTFSFLPRWRRDDGQISLSHTGGGIGPHVDDYDVFLIQMSGIRSWEVGSRFVSKQEEIDGLVDGLDIRILQGWNKDIEAGLIKKLTLKPGDVLYLPPRVAHCGIALCDNSMTLSVGLRAPCVKEMMIKFVEEVREFDSKFTTRYQDPELLNQFFTEGKDSFNVRNEEDNCEISREVKDKAKKMYKDAIIDLLDDDSFFDSFFGKLVTESKRFQFNYPLTLDDIDPDLNESLGLWGNSKLAVQAMLNGEGNLYAAEGISWAHSNVEQYGGDAACRLFINGEMWEIKINHNEVIQKMVQTIANRRELNRALFIGHEQGIDRVSDVPQEIIQLLEDLVGQGFLYGADNR